MESSQIKVHLIMAGDRRVGKSSITNMYMKKEFIDTLDDHFKTYKPKGWDKEMKVNIWDFGNKSYHRHRTPPFFRVAHGVIITFDVTN